MTQTPAATEERIVSRQRVSDHGEVFTASREVTAMLDLVKQETERIDSRFLEPACGNGNFLAEILQRKLGVVGHAPADHANRRTDLEGYVAWEIHPVMKLEVKSD
jgi:hypothetical protein